MMRYLPGLSLIERLALWILVRSPRTSLVVVKELHWPTVFTAANPADPLAAHVTGGEPEPASMQLERIFHQPSYGEEE
jgi:hypothetical protein